MKLYAQRIFVDDLTAAKHFYGETLGLTQLWEWGGIAIGYDVGAVLIVEQEQRDDDEESVVGRFIGCTLSVDDIHATYERLRAKEVSFLGPPEYMAWGGTLTYFRDPSGNVLALMESATQH